MKKIIVLMIALLMTMSAFSQNNSLIPEIDLGEAEFSLNGYASFFNESDGFDTWNFCNLRLRPEIKFNDITFFSEVNLEDEKNWLRILQLQYNFNDNWCIRGGRIFAAAAYFSPSPFKLETVEYPQMRFTSSYVWGLQIDGTFGEGWRLLADVSARSGVSFDDDKNWEYPEMSARLQKTIGNFSAAYSMQISEDYQRFGFDETWRINKDLYFRQGNYFEENDDLGSYFLSVYRLFDWLELHSQFEYRKINNKPNADVILTNGFRIFSKKDLLSFTVDFESTLKGEKDDRVLGRLQFRF
ncbi:MAG: hypothetical protein WCV41_01800 [Patescibacteria group bacterium]